MLPSRTWLWFVGVFLAKYLLMRFLFPGAAAPVTYPPAGEKSVAPSGGKSQKSGEKSVTPTGVQKKRASLALRLKR
jgi:hypothetical protein